MEKEITFLIISILMIGLVSSGNGCLPTDTECGNIPTSGCDVRQNTTFNTGIYDMTMRAGIDICANEIVLDCNKSILSSVGFGSNAINLKFINNTIIKNCKTEGYNNGIFIENSNKNILVNISASQAFSGIILKMSNNNNRIINSTFFNNSIYGILLLSSKENFIINNYAYFNGGGVDIGDGTFNNSVISNFIFSNYGAGITLDRTFNNLIDSNTIINSSIGVILFSSDNIISNNIINNNSFSGIFLFLSSINNIIYNNLLNNTNNAQDNGQNLWNTTLDCTKINIIGGPCIGGNFWSDYIGEDVDSNGIGDTTIPFGPGDYLPLVPILDADSDGIPDSADNCPETSNPHQEDSNNNGIGDACEKNQIAADCNQDGILNVFDIVCYIKTLYPGFNLLDRTRSNFPCNTEEANKIILDINGDNKINNEDIAYLGEYLFKNGPAPVQGLMCINAIDCPNNFACEIGEGASTSKATIKEAIEQIEKNQEIELYVKEQTLSLLNQYQQCALNGDVDQNKKVNINDYYALKYYLSGSYKINSCLCNADVNEDKKIDYSDASALYHASYYNNLPKEAECETIQSSSPNPSISPTPYY